MGRLPHSTEARPDAVSPAAVAPSAVEGTANAGWPGDAEGLSQAVAVFNVVQQSTLMEPLPSSTRSRRSASELSRVSRGMQVPAPMKHPCGVETGDGSSQRWHRRKVDGFGLH